MLSRLATWFQRLRTWLAVRLGLWRGQWRRGQVGVPDARLVPTLLANDTWSYGLYCPTGLRDDAPAPLIVLLHGCKQRALGFAQASGFTRAAERERVRLLCPEQRTRANLWRCWNWFVPAAQRGAGELLVVRAMLADVRNRHAACGWSGCRPVAGWPACSRSMPQTAWTRSWRSLHRRCSGAPTRKTRARC